MTREIAIDESYRTTRLFDCIKKGDTFKIPFDKSRHSGIKMEALRRNRDARLTGKLKGKLDIMFRVSQTESPGYTTLIRLK